MTGCPHHERLEKYERVQDRSTGARITDWAHASRKTALEYRAPSRDRKVTAANEA
jgi:hypothetical protein